MKRSLSLSMALVVLSVLLNGCFKDVVTEKYTFYRPVYKTKAEVRANIKSALPQPVKQPGKLFIKGNYIFLNELEKGIHVIDYSNPTAPQNIGFIAIPGNIDLAVNGNYLYVDLYTDLVTLDISNPQNVSLAKINEGVFPEKYYTADSNSVIVDWVRVDTIVKNRESVNWEKDIVFTNAFTNGPMVSSAASPGSAGKAGSMARFSLMNDRLYTVSHSDLKVFNITNASSPVYVKQVNAGWNIETIYPFRNNLFIGSMSGMFIFSVTNPDNPVKTGQFLHATACDPVIADDSYAYVTLRSGSFCQGFANQMDVINVSNLASPSLVKSYQFTNPRGLSKDGNYIFLCDGTDGLKILNVANANNITNVKTIPGIETYDVIAFNSIAVTVAKDGLYLIDYSNMADIKVAGKILVQK
jgi:hypothetical protein